jgi:hypothetical protein
MACVQGRTVVCDMARGMVTTPFNFTTLLVTIEAALA